MERNYCAKIALRVHSDVLFPSSSSEEPYEAWHISDSYCVHKHTPSVPSSAHSGKRDATSHAAKILHSCGTADPATGTLLWP